MSITVIASSPADSAAAAAIRAHHAEMAGALRLRVASVIRSSAHGTPAGAADAVAELVAWCRSDLLPHALAEERTLYAAARAHDAAALLVTAMTAEHQVILALVSELAATSGPVQAAGTARALEVLFESHLEKENELVVPLLESAPDVALADLLDGMHHLVGDPAGQHAVDGAGGEASAAGTGHTCDCGHAEEAGYPELDARAIPHAIRHATIFGALAGVRPGGGLVLVAPHDPIPLLAQIEQAHPGRFAVEYLERGPEAWRLAFVVPAA